MVSFNFSSVCSSFLVQQLHTMCWHFSLYSAPPLVCKVVYFFLCAYITQDIYISSYYFYSKFTKQVYKSVQIWMFIVYFCFCSVYCKQQPYYDNINVIDNLLYLLLSVTCYCFTLYSLLIEYGRRNRLTGRNLIDKYFYLNLNIKVLVIPLSLRRIPTSLGRRLGTEKNVFTVGLRLSE